RGGSSSSTLTVTVTGTNDAPVAVADVAGVREHTTLVRVCSKVVSTADVVDSLDTHTVSAVIGGTDNGTTITVVGTYGTLVVTKATGAYTYTRAKGQANVQPLADGQHVTDVFTYTNSDNHGLSSSSTLTVTVTGTNDAPVAVVDVAAVTEDSESNPVSGNVLTNDTDVDTGDTHSVTAVNGNSGNVGHDVAGTYGTLHLKSEGSCVCTHANGQANAQALTKGKQVTDVCNDPNADTQGGSSSSTLTVTVTGTKDAPVAVADVAAVTEDSESNPVSGNVLSNDTDVDTGDSHSVTAVNGNSYNVGHDVCGIYGTLHL